MNKKTEKNLFPEKRVSSIGFILNEEQQILLVKPSYYKYWHLPGGFVDKNESPLQAVSREIKEEINLDLKAKSLIIVNYNSGTDEQQEVIVFVFDFGVISDNEFNGLTLDNTEIIDSGFFNKEQAMKLVGPERSKRLEMCYLAHQKSAFYYLNDNVPFSEN